MSPLIGKRLARETGRHLGELGVRPEDDGWIRVQARTLASLGIVARRPGALARSIQRLARKAMRIAR
jgi:hypothetical protein